MNFFGFSISAGAWLAPVTGVAVLGMAATLILLRDHLRLERHVMSLETENERLTSEVWRLAGQSEPHRSIVEASRDLVVMRDHAGFVTFANESFAEFARQRRNALIGSQLLPRPAIVRPARDLGRGAVLVEECYRDPHGERWIAWIEVSTDPGMLRIGRDITDYVTQQRSIETDAFNAGVRSQSASAPINGSARAIRTAANGILGLSDLVLDTPLTGDQQAHLQSIRSLSEGLLAALPSSGTAAPERKSHVAPSATVPSAGSDGESPIALRRVLLVEDDETNALLALKSLETTGIASDWAKDGQEALDLVKQAFADDRTYDLILMDLRMPRMNGFEATQRIRSLEATLDRPEPIRIVAVSATTMRRDREAAHRAGVDAFLPKPYLAASLTQVLRSPARRLKARRG